MNMISPKDSYQQAANDVSRSRFDGVYAITMTNDSMLPRWGKDDVVFIDPKKSTKKGDYVLVKTTTEGVAFLGRLYRRNKREIVIQHHNPEANIPLKTSDIESIQKVLTPNELYL